MRIKISLLLLFHIVCSLSCSNDDDTYFQDAPNGQYRVLEKICYCYFPNDNSIEYWIFDKESNSLTILKIDSGGQQLSSDKLYYNVKGTNLIIGDGREYSQKTVAGVLELTYLDNPGIADDELVVKLVAY